jgi:hypothetical protein
MSNVLLGVLCKEEVCKGIRTVSWDTWSAMVLVWWRKRTVETSPKAAKHLGVTQKEGKYKNEEVRERKSKQIQSK